jgi:murein DD-endopeptidase MepM/ murein hydrolase activator NlpD
MRRVSGFGAVALLLLPQQVHLLEPSPSQPVSVAVAQTFSEPVAARAVKGIIGRDATVEKLLGKAVSPAVIHHVVQTARPLYDLARITAGHTFDFTLDPQGLLAFTYAIDELRTLHVTRNGDGLEAEVRTRQYEARTEQAAGVIQSSLFAAVAEAGEEDQLALDLAQIFEWDVDFNTELQRGDRFRVAVDKLYLGGQFARYGTIHSAELVRGDRVITAVRFEGRGKPEYYTPAGVPLRKTFLRSPLRFTRISSRFSRARFHPVLKRMRPHLGVDYAAPVGTPVRAAADGVVTLAGWWGGYGKTVRLRHGRGLQTLYGHLSRLNVKPGQRVSQGDLIGAVGTTGLSSGPHLDYRTLRDGVYVNPLTIQPPPPEPVPTALRPAFDATCDRALALLDQGHGAVRVAAR